MVDVPAGHLPNLLLRWSKGFEGLGFIVEARRLEHHYPHSLKVKYKGSQH